MVIVEQLDNVLAVNNELQYLLEWIFNRICCLYVVSLLILCYSKDVLDKQMNTMRTASLEVARWEHVMQQYPSLLTGGCIVSNCTSNSMDSYFWMMWAMSSAMYLRLCCCWPVITDSRKKEHSGDTAM